MPFRSHFQICFFLNFDIAVKRSKKIFKYVSQSIHKMYNKYKIKTNGAQKILSVQKILITKKDTLSANSKNNFCTATQLLVAV